MTRVEVYSKKRCPLCEDATEILQELRSRYEFELVLHDIESDPKLWERFKYDVPVVFISGERAFKHRLIPADVEKRLLAAGTSVAQKARDGASLSATRGEGG